MDTNTILSVVIIAGQIAMFFFFREQIKSKNRVIKDLQILMDTTDIKRLSEYYKEMDNLSKKNVLATKKHLIHVFDDTLQEHYNQIGRQFDEMATFIESLYTAIPEEEKRNEFIKRHMPTCVNMFPFPKEDKEAGYLRT